MNIKLPGLIALSLLLIGSSGVYAYQTPISYISIDINPSIELGISAFDVVVSAEAYNDDGEKVLENVDIKGETIEDVVNMIVDSAIAEGFVQEDGTSVISITTETDNIKLVEGLTEAAEEGVEKALMENETKAEIEEDNVTLERRTEAKALGITPGKLNLIQKLQEVNPDATIDDYKESSVKEIMMATREAKGIVPEKKEKNSNSDENASKNKDNETEVELDVKEPIVEDSNKVEPTDINTVKVLKPKETKVAEDKKNNPVKETKTSKETPKKEEPAKLEPSKVEPITTEPVKEKNPNNGNSNKVELEKVEPVKTEPEKKTNNGKSKGN